MNQSAIYCMKAKTPGSGGRRGYRFAEFHVATETAALGGTRKTGGVSPTPPVFRIAVHLFPPLPFSAVLEK